jgi:aspartate/methionine/tyrosine aminotransferase
MHNTGVDIDDYGFMDSLLIPGEKPMIWLLPIACWANRNDSDYKNKWYMRNAPAYDLIGTWSEYLWEESYIWPIYSYDDFKLKVSNIPNGRKPKMIITVKPGNPCPVWATRAEWEELIVYCIANSIRLVNDWAYTSVVHKNHISLTEIAKDYAELDWIEMFSISKTLSACGWRLWVAVWSKDFIWELTKIKWNADSWVFWPLAIWLNKYLSNPDSKEDMKNIQEMYKKRLDILIPIFQEFWLVLSCPSDAWFFMLFMCPKFLDWEEVLSSEDFNNKMINKIGLVWVPFVWSDIDWQREQFIRYSACYDALKIKNIDRLRDTLNKVKIEY